MASTNNIVAADTTVTRDNRPSVSSSSSSSSSSQPASIFVTMSTTSNTTKSIFNFSQEIAFQVIMNFVNNNLSTIRSPTTIVLLCLYIPIFIFSLAGNTFVIYLFFKHQHMRRVKSLFLVNLAMADEAVTVVCMPLIVAQTVFKRWIYGQFMCKLAGYMQGLSVVCSIFTLTALSIDHYMTVRSPRRDKRRYSKHQTIALLIAIWIVSAAFLFPIFYVRQVNLHNVELDQFQITETYCVENWPRPSDRQLYAVFLLLATYVVPMVVIVVSYTMVGRIICSSSVDECQLHQQSGSTAGVSQSSATACIGPCTTRLAIVTDRRAIVRLLITIVTVFVVCWLPYNVISLSLDLRLDLNQTRLLPFALWLGHAHSAVNPVVYWFFNKTFRHCISNVLHCSMLRKHMKRDTHSSQYV